MIQEILDKIEKERKDCQTNAEKILKEIFDYSLQTGIKKIEINFSGYGDSGNIDDVSIYPDDIKISHEYSEKIDSFAYEYLSGTGVDWYNNDGGQGHIIINFESIPFELNVQVNVNTMQTKTEFEYNGILPI